MEDRIEEEKITIKLNEKEKDDKLQLGKIDNIKAFNDMLKYTKKYKNKNGVYITFDEGILDISNSIIIHVYSIIVTLLILEYKSFSVRNI